MRDDLRWVAFYGGAREAVDGQYCASSSQTSRIYFCVLCIFTRGKSLVCAESSEIGKV